MKFVTTISLIALTAATPALAQTPDGEPGTLPGDEIIVTASRSGEGIKASQLGASVTVIDNATLEARQTRVVSDVLRDVPGIAVSRIGAMGGQTQVRLRGSESNHVLVLIDGIEAADPYYGEYDFGTLIADPAVRIEVLRGQQSSLYGSDAIGGVINYITLSGREAPGISARAEGGSFGTFNGAARVAGASDAIDYALSASYYDTDGYPTARGGNRDIGSQSLGASGKLNWTPTDTLKLTGVLRYSLTKADTNNSEYDPASPLFGYTVDSPGVRYRNEALYGLLSAQLTALDGRWINTLSGQFADTTRKGYASYGFDYGDKGRRYKGSFTSSLTLGTEAVTHRITGAVDVERESFRNLSSFAFMGKRHTDNLGIVGQYELTAGALSLGGSLRYDENNRFDDTTTWRVQGSYLLPTGTRIRAAYGTGLKNPGYYELYGYMDGTYIGNPNLKPEKSEGWEAGLEQSVGGWATIGATWFDSTLKDEIYTSYPAPDFIATPANRDTKSKQHGIEAFVSAQPLPQLRFDLAYTWLNAKEDGVREIRRPRHVASFNTTVSTADQRLSGTLTIRYNGRMTDTAYTDPSYIPITVSMQEYVLVNLSLDYKLSRNIALFGRIENLADEEYEEVFSFATAGRAAYGGVRLTF
ncbi:TonB-dependent receptor [Sphingobium lactosutens]|uniref:TonB-dependent receptor plug domain-containing protein n=1 Tax=Sphingobium lactosutens TaxID=522773 RepID=UPI0015C07CAC|nr:TonB-dependent receptor [Sphingobium lactosutens]NWK96421.1 TonB-dependent receptor [Sphingobium lactosutens]